MFIKQTLPKPKTSRTVLLVKTNTLGLFSLAIFPNESRLVTIDTRLEEPAIRIYREPKPPKRFSKNNSKSLSKMAGPSHTTDHHFTAKRADLSWRQTLKQFLGSARLSLARPNGQERVPASRARTRRANHSRVSDPKTPAAPESDPRMWFFTSSPATLQF